MSSQGYWVNKHFDECLNHLDERLKRVEEVLKYSLSNQPNPEPTNSDNHLFSLAEIRDRYLRWHQNHPADKQTRWYVQNCVGDLIEWLVEPDSWLNPDYKLPTESVTNSGSNECNSLRKPYTEGRACCQNTSKACSVSGPCSTYKEREQSEWDKAAFREWLEEVHNDWRSYTDGYEVINLVINQLDSGQY